MKKIALVSGTIIAILGGVQVVKYIFDYNILSEYGQGYVWGSLFLVLLGSILIFIGLKKNSRPTPNP